MGKRVRMEDWESPEGLEMLRKIAKLKLDEIAGIIGISRTTLNKWCIKSEKINDALRQKLDEETARRVEQAVIESCFDRKVRVKIKKQVVDRNGDVHDLEEVKEQVIPADTRAQRFVLTNRAPNRWQEKVTVEAEGDGVTVASFIPVQARMETPGEDTGDHG